MATTARTLALGLLLLAGASHADAQTIYKCVADGKTSYGQQPCTHGVSSEITVPPARAVTADDKANLERQKQELAKLEQQRMARQSQEADAQQQAAEQATDQRKNCASLKLELKWADENAATPNSAEAAAAKTQLQRAQQRLQQACGS